MYIYIYEETHIYTYIYSICIYMSFLKCRFYLYALAAKQAVIVFLFYYFSF